MHGPAPQQQPVDERHVVDGDRVCVAVGGVLAGWHKNSIDNIKTLGKKLYFIFKTYGRYKNSIHNIKPAWKKLHFILRTLSWRRYKKAILMRTRSPKQLSAVETINWLETIWYKKQEMTAPSPVVWNGSTTASVWPEWAAIAAPKDAVLMHELLWCWTPCSQNHDSIYVKKIGTFLLRKVK